MTLVVQEALRLPVLSTCQRIHVGGMIPGRTMTPTDVANEMRGGRCAMWGSWRVRGETDESL